MIDILELQDVESHSTSTSDGYQTIEAELLAPHQCACGYQFGPGLPGWRLQQFADAPIRRRPVRLHLGLPGRCPRCKQTMRRPAFLHEKREMTRRCHDYISSHALALPSTKIAELAGVSASTVDRIVRSQQQVLKERFKPYIPVRMGIDEVRVRNTYRLSIVDLDACVIVDLLPDHHDPTLLRWLSQFAAAERAMVSEVAMDQTERYRAITKNMCPSATVVYDKFHLVRMVNTALSKTFRATGWKAANKGKIGSQNRKLLWAKRSNIEKFGMASRLRLDGLLSNCGILAAAYEAKEEFHAILQSRFSSTTKANNAVRNWLANLAPGLEEHFSQVRSAIDRWRPAVLAMLCSQTTNSPTEGLNRVIKLAAFQTPRANFDQLRIRLLMGGRRKGVSQNCSCCSETPNPGEELRVHFGILLCSHCETALRDAELPA